MIRICLFDGWLVCKLSTYVIVLGWERHLEAPKSDNIFIVFVPSYHYYESYSSFVEDFSIKFELRSLAYSNTHPRIRIALWKSDAKQPDSN